MGSGTGIDPFALNGVDLALVGVVLLGIWRGWRLGFVAGVLELVGLALALLIAFHLTPYLAEALAHAGWLRQPWALPASFLAIFVLAQAIVGALARRLARRGPIDPRARRADRTFGLLPGAAGGLINAMVVAVVLTTLPIADALTRASQRSVLAARLGTPAEWLERHLAPIFDPAIERAMQALTVQPQSHERVALPFTLADAPPRPDLEASMLVLVNDERAKAGLRALAADADAVPVSRAHSRDMFARGYFSHETPEGLSPFDRQRAAGLRSRAAGENLALARTLPMAHQGLMNSPGHRANILNPAFGRLGIGILDGGRYGLMITQTFRN